MKNKSSDEPVLTELKNVEQNTGLDKDVEQIRPVDESGTSLNGVKAIISINIV